MRYYYCIKISICQTKFTKIIEFHFTSCYFLLYNVLSKNRRGEDMNGVSLLIATCIILSIVLVAITLTLIHRRRIQKLKEEIASLDKEKNLIVSMPIMSELTKVEAILKNEKLEEKYREWQKRFYRIKDERIPEITDMIIELDLLSGTKDRQGLELRLAKTEIEVYKARESVDELMEEIKEVTLSEEKYRSIITKLKNKYRGFVQEFQLHKADYEEMETIIELQLENIEKRFQDFETSMENNEYDEVVHIVKALDAMIDHMSIIIVEIPNLLLMSKMLIPKRIEEIEHIYQDMTENGYSLDYLKIDYNMKESKKHLKDILDRIKVLNLEDCMFELKTMLDYLDGIFNDFEKEKLCRKLYDEVNSDFERRLRKTNRIVKDMYDQLDDIKSMYHLKSKDIQELDKVKLRLEKLNSDYEEILEKATSVKLAYSKLVKDIEELSGSLTEIEEDLDIALKNLGSMYDDEVRARDQLEEIEDLLRQCKIRIRMYKLPIIHNHYFIELSEANDAILEIVKELDKKPIMIKVLNTRVDTARDLVLKLYNTTTDMIKKAKLAEESIVYGNRYRSLSPELDYALSNAEDLFQKGMYQEALDVSVEAIEAIDQQVHKKLSRVS